jgi:acetyl esterase/lipase
MKIPTALSALLLMTQLQAAPFSQFLQDTPEPVIKTYKTINGVPLNLEIFSPTDLKAGDKRPCVVLIHGGAWLAGDGKVFYPHARYFASRGAVAISVEYRLAKPVSPTVADCFTDCKSAMRYIRAHAAEWGIDPDRIVAMGDSAGGHLAGALGTCEGFDDPADDIKFSAAPNAMILCNPIVDMTQGAWINHIIRGAALEKKAKPEDQIPNEAQNKLAKELSPLFHVKPGQAPTLLMHGLDDHVVTPDQARQYAAAQEAVKNRCDLVLLEGARHAFIVAKYTASEEMVVNTVRKADEFLISLGWLIAPATLEVSTPPAWEVKKK